MTCKQSRSRSNSFKESLQKNERRRKSSSRFQMRHCGKHLLSRDVPGTDQKENLSMNHAVQGDIWQLILASPNVRSWAEPQETSFWERWLIGVSAHHLNNIGENTTIVAIGNKLISNRVRTSPYFTHPMLLTAYTEELQFEGADISSASPQNLPRDLLRQGCRDRETSIHWIVQHNCHPTLPHGYLIESFRFKIRSCSTVTTSSTCSKLLASRSQPSFGNYQRTIFDLPVPEQGNAA